MNKKGLLIIGMFLLICITTTISFAFFTYSKIGDKRITIRAGSVNFTYTEGAEAVLSNSFPVEDTVGAVDTTGEYLFSVSYTGTDEVIYTVYAVDNNKDVSKSYFKNEQIKYAIVKNGAFIGGTSSNQGLLMSSIAGFTNNLTTGEGVLVPPQTIATGEIDNYKLRLWIDKAVDYTNVVDSDGKSTGKYNGFTYSLKVKVESN